MKVFLWLPLLYVMPIIYSKRNINPLQCYWDEFFEASGVQGAQQARKIYTSSTGLLMWRFYFSLTIVGIKHALILLTKSNGLL